MATKHNGSKKSAMQQQELGHDAIAHLAKQIWEQDGRPAGRDLEYWLRAEQALRASTISATSAKPRTSP